VHAIKQGNRRYIFFLSALTGAGG